MTCTARPCYLSKRSLRATKVTYRQVVLIWITCYGAADVFSALFTSVVLHVWISLLPLSSRTLDRKWVKEANEFPDTGQGAEPEHVRGPQWWPLSHADTECSLNPFLCHSPFTHANPLYSGPGINYLIYFRSGAFYSSARCAWTLSLWRTLMNVSGAEPLIISAVNAARHTPHWLLAASNAHKDPPSRSIPPLFRFVCTQRNNSSYATDLDALSFSPHINSAETEMHSLLFWCEVLKLFHVPD